MEQEKNKPIDKFCHLHVHSTYSFVDGYGTPTQYIEKAKELGQPAIAVTDHGNSSAHFKWYKISNENGITPILGCEMYIAPYGEEDEKNFYHITVLSKNNEGYENLLWLVTDSWKNFYRKPLITIEKIIEHQKGLVILSGCISSRVGNLIKKNRIEDAKKEMVMMSEKIDDYYVELSPLEFKEGKDIIEKTYKLAKELNIPIVATMDCHYVNEDEAIIQEILLCIQSGGNMNELPANKGGKRWTFDQEGFFLKTRKQMEDSFKKTNPDFDIKDALDNTIKIAEMIDFEFPKASQLKFPIPEKEKIIRVKKICNEGLRRIGKEEDKNYRDRMAYELDIIEKKDFLDYFLIMHDLVMWAKNKDILVGPARGSSAGSLVCYLMRITEVDPIKWDLIFERFIDMNRMDLPDIDVDFEDERRIEVKRYMEKKYGEKNVGQIATFSTFKGKAILNDFGRIYRVPFKDMEVLKGLIIERSEGDSRASFTIEDTFNEFEKAREILSKYPGLKNAHRMEGQLRNLSSHASGLVIGDVPLTNVCAKYIRNEESLISLDYADTTDLGLIKFDILGLNTLTAISKALKLIKERIGKDIDIYNVPLNDESVFKNFRDKNKLFGIFQFDGQAVNQVCRQVQPKNFEDLSAINALSRPGPMHGLDDEENKPITTVYIARRAGKMKIKYTHELLKPITEDTYGVVIYQEQVMKVMRQIGKMSWKHTAEIRKNISRSRGVEAFNEFKEIFAVGARENGLTEKEIDSIWSAICTHGSWSFNKSHSISYSMISYWTMWLKTYYPIEYYAAMSSTVHNEDKVRKIIKEYKREGFELLSLDINKSKKSFSIDNNNLRIGFIQVKGIGTKTAEIIESNQPYADIADFRKKASKGVKLIGILNKLGAFDSIGGANRTLDTLFGREKENKYEEGLTFEEVLELCPISTDFNIIDNWNDFIKDNIKDNITKIENVDSKEKSQTIMGIIYDKNLKDVIEEALSHGRPVPDHKEGYTKFCNFFIEDDSDFVTVRVSTRNYQDFKKLIFEETRDSDIIMIRGKMGDGIRMFFANEIICLNHLETKIKNGIKIFTMSENILMGKVKYRPFNQSGFEIKNKRPQLKW